MSYVVVEQTDGRYAVFGGNGVICVSDEIEDARTIRDALNHVPYAVERAALLREWLDTEIDPEDEEYGPWMESFTARVKAAISGLEISNVPNLNNGSTGAVKEAAPHVSADVHAVCPKCGQSPNTEGTYCTVAGCPNMNGPAICPTPRTPADYAIEHAGYLAVSAARLLDAINAVDEITDDDRDPPAEGDEIHAAFEARSEAMQGVRSMIYEFEKRRDRAQTCDSQSALPPLGRFHQFGCELLAGGEDCTRPAQSKVQP